LRIGDLRDIPDTTVTRALWTNMASIFETITKRLAEAWKSEEPAGRGH
jgi:hypothetical protein